MSQADHDTSEQMLASLLIAYDEALDRDTQPAIDEALVADGELKQRFGAARACLDLLDRVRRFDEWSTINESIQPRAGQRAAEPVSPPIGQKIGRFRVERELGRGGLGVVYLATDPELARQVALKVPRADVLANGEIARRFVHEAEAAARLSHPHLVGLHEVGHEDALCYIVSEYCPGPTLAEWLRRQAGPVPVRQGAALVLRVAEGVQHAHSRGVLHRDIKPSNVLMARAAEGADGILSREGLDVSPKLTDFGMAKLLEQEHGETRAGAILGTLAYMSPEQAEGHIDRLDARTDIYSLGALLYELLTGTPPYTGKTDADTLRQLVTNEPRAPRQVRRDVPRDLEAIALRCLSRRPADRYATAHELAVDLQRFLAGEPTNARPLGAGERAWKWARRRPAVAALIAVSCAALVGLLVVTTAYNARLQSALGESRQLLYVADMQTGFDAFEHGNLATLQEGLNRFVPASGDEDLRTIPWRLLHQWSTAGQRELYRHADKVLAVAYSADGKLLASAAMDGTIRVWDVAAARPVCDLRGHTNDVNELAFSPDGRLLASAADDSSVRLWTLDGSAEPRVLANFSNLAAYGVAFSPDGSLLAVACEDSKVRLWNTHDWTLSQTWSAHTKRVNQVAFSADGSRLVSCSSDGTVCIFSVERGEVLVTFEGKKTEDASFSRVAFSPDGRSVATASWTERVCRIIDAEDGTLIRKLSTNDGAVHTLAFSPDSRMLATGQRNGIVRLWSMATYDTSAVLLGHYSAVRDLAFSPDGGTLVTASSDTTVKAWDLAAVARRESQLFTAGSVETVAYQPAGHLLAMVDNLGGVTLADARTRRATLRIQPGTVGKFLPLAFSTDGKLLAYAAAAGREAHVFDLERRATVAQFDCAGGQVSALAFTPTGHELLIASDRPRLTMWDIATSRQLVDCDPGQREVFAIIHLNRSNLLLTAGQDGVKLRHPRSLAEQTALAPFAHPIRAVAVSPDESLLVGGSSTGDVPVWDLGKRQFKTTLVGNAGWVSSVAFSPDGKSFVSCHSDATLKLWDVRTFHCAGIVAIDRLAGPRTGVGTAAFSPDGRTLAAGGGRANYGVVRFWSLEAETRRDAEGDLRSPDARFAQVDCLRNGVVAQHLEVRSRLTLDERELLGDTLAIRGGSQAFFFDLLVVGKARHGDVVVSGKSTVSSTANVLIAANADCVGRLEVAEESTWEANGPDIVVGIKGSGTLAVASGGVVRAGAAVLGDKALGHGVATVDGPGSVWILSKWLRIGEWGSGELQVSNGGRVRSDGSLAFAHYYDSRGVASIAAGSTLTSVEMDIGVRGEGRLVVLPGGSLLNKVACIGTLSGSSGAVVVEGPTASWACSDSLAVGGLGRAELVVRSGATVRVGDRITVGSLGKISLLGGSLSAESLALSGKSGLSISGGSLTVNGHAELNGVLTVDFDDVDAAVAAGKLRLIVYGSHIGQFATINGPPHLQLEPVYDDKGLDLVIRRLK